MRAVVEAKNAEELKRERDLERARLQEERIATRRSLILELGRIAREENLDRLKVFVEDFRVNPKSLNFGVEELRSIVRIINPEDLEYKQKVSLIGNLMPFLFFANIKKGTVEELQAFIRDFVEIVNKMNVDQFINKHRERILINLFSRSDLDDKAKKTFCDVISESMITELISYDERGRKVVKKFSLYNSLNIDDIYQILFEKILSLDRQSVVDVIGIIKQIPDVNSVRDVDGVSLLDSAFMISNLMVAVALIKRGALIDTVGMQRFFKDIIKNHNEDFLQLMIDCDIEVSEETLQAAIEEGEVSSVAMLLDKVYKTTDSASLVDNLLVYFQTKIGQPTNEKAVVYAAIFNLCCDRGCRDELLSNAAFDIDSRKREIRDCIRDFSSQHYYYRSYSLAKVVSSIDGTNRDISPRDYEEPTLLSNALLETIVEGEDEDGEEISSKDELLILVIQKLSRLIQEETRVDFHKMQAISRDIAEASEFVQRQVTIRDVKIIKKSQEEIKFLMGIYRDFGGSAALETDFGFDYPAGYDYTQHGRKRAFSADFTPSIVSGFRHRSSSDPAHDFEVLFDLHKASNVGGAYGGASASAAGAGAGAGSGTSAATATYPDSALVAAMDASRLFDDVRVRGSGGGSAGAAAVTAGASSYSESDESSILKIFMDRMILLHNSIQSNMRNIERKSPDLSKGGGASRY